MRSKPAAGPVVYVSPDEFHVQVAQPLPVVPPQPPGPAPADLDRAARLEIEALQSLLRSLPPGQAGDLRSEAGTRMQELATQLGIQLPPEALNPGGN